MNKVIIVIRKVQCSINKKQYLRKMFKIKVIIRKRTLKALLKVIQNKKMILESHKIIQIQSNINNSNNNNN